jgi:hypothetical protein
MRNGPQRWRTRLFRLLPAVAVAIMALEVFGHFWAADPLVISDLVQRTNDALAFRGRPGAKVDYAGVLVRLPPVRVELNSLGFRDDEPLPGDRRPQILVLGDSNTFGLGVRQDRTFPALLKKRLPADNVLNLAVPGYNFAQEAGLFRTMPPSYALTVFVLFDNDFSPIVGLHERPPCFGVLRHLALYRLYFIWRYVARIEDDESAARRGYGRALELLHDLKSFPRPIWFLMLHRPPFKITEFERQVRQDFRWLDCEDIYRQHNFPADKHLDEAGHRLVAERLYAAIVDAGLQGGPEARELRSAGTRPPDRR